MHPKVLNIHWKDWCWSWKSNTLATLCVEPTHWIRPWCWERLKAGGEGDDRGWDGWMAWPTQWTWVWVNSRSWRWTGRPGVLQSMESQRVGHDWTTELNGQKSDLFRPPRALFPAIVSPLSQKHILFFYTILPLTWENVWIPVLKTLTGFHMILWLASPFLFKKKFFFGQKIFLVSFFHFSPSYVFHQFNSLGLWVSSFLQSILVTVIRDLCFVWFMDICLSPSWAIAWHHSHY